MDAKKKGLIIMYHQIHSLRKHEGFSIQRIADYLQINFRTAKKLLGMSEEEFDRFMEKKFSKPCLLDPYKDFIIHYLKQFEDAPASVVHDRIKEHFPLFPTVDPKTVYNYVMHLRKQFNIPKVTASERQYTAVPDLAPGEQAQVDFGEKKLRTSNGEYVKVHFFIMLLCYSRQKFVLFRDSPFTSDSAAMAHELAFSYFKGIPQEIIYDQDSVFLHRENLGDYVMTDTFNSYQSSRPFRVVFCRAADPESKGKVENTVRYVKNNFLFHRTFIDINQLNTEALNWLERTGNAMVHNTTRRIPQEQWLKEQPYLITWHPLFPQTREEGHRVLKTNTVKYRGNSYSVPFGTYKNEETRVHLKEEGSYLDVCDHSGQTIARHQIPAGVGNNIVNNNHRRDTSIKLDQLRSRVKDCFMHSSNILCFVDRIDQRYPRYVRDQLSTLLILAESYGAEASEKAMDFCVHNELFSANDFKSLLESSNKVKKSTEKTTVKPLGGTQTQLLANIEPDKSRISEYELIFNQNTSNHEPVHTTN